MNINLSDLTLDNIGLWPYPVKLGLVGVVFLMLTGLGYWLMVKPNFDEYARLKNQELGLRSDFELKQFQASNLMDYKYQLVLMQERFGKMLKQLPTKNEMPGILEDISKTGVASGLIFNLFAPMPEVVHDFYIELPIKIAVVGNYHQFAIFLSRIVQMSRIVTLHDLEIDRPTSDKTPSDKEKEIPGDKLTMKLTAKIYRYRTQ